MSESLPRAMVLKSYTPEPGQAVRLGAGDPVLVGEESPAYPGWVRITVPNGSKRWAPEAYVRAELGTLRGLSVRGGSTHGGSTHGGSTRGEPGIKGRMLVEYDSTELPVTERQWVTALLEQKGWAWVRTDDGREGWIPLDVLGPYEPQPPDLPASYSEAGL